ncbi:pyridoxamine 5'-phosphate oxidase family protein [Roseomonas sp. OT10]|uniref:pyridoxamine 5'-phosphate oxidase family protein n=1 Tax=Roseomonas cutis TaxID=2897332 RepID=UPI001E479F42|nr:pyridoxamine 5'-phosphate oxidase family protein [Roseomonas sp. OT10]UFN47549.1 pyridoxamine 5'-phosphate oxidase family protein [Roseomonas sp. OT10]
MPETRTDRDAQNKVWELIKDISITTMVTLDAEGRMRGRPMQAQQKSFDTTLWFFTTRGTAVTQEIEADSRVLLAYAAPSSQNYVSLFGRAKVFQDVAKQKELWSESLRVWFPGGAEDPAIALIAVEVEGAEYWDAPSSTLLHAYGYVKAVTTGEPPKGGENAKVAFT